MRNILLITADQFRYDMLGMLGKHPVKTPNLDRLAREGTIFESAYCPNPLCVPTRASIMTGLRSCDHGVYYNDQGWANGTSTLAQRLAEGGYYATEVGKTHFHPRRRHAGFHRVWELGVAYAEDLAAHGLDEAPPGTRAGVHRSYKTTPTHLPKEFYKPVRITDKAIEELGLIAERRRCRRSGYEGFFMWLSYVHPHTPCDPPEPYFSMYDRGALTPFVRGEDELAGFSQPLKRWRTAWEFLDDEWCRKMRAQYMGDVTLVDEQIGRVLAVLDELGVRDNTLVVFTSDHGDYLGDHWLQQKGFFHECSSRVPLIFNGPGICAGQSLGGHATLLDLYPTLLDYEHLWVPTRRDAEGRLIYQNAEDVPGRSLVPALKGEEKPDPERVVISESAIHGRHLMVRYRNLKLNYYFNTQEWDVFDLAADPEKLHNLRSETRVQDLPAPMQEAFRDVALRMERWQDGHYYFNGKLRPMFT